MVQADWHEKAERRTSTENDLEDVQGWREKDGTKADMIWINLLF